VIVLSKSQRRILEEAHLAERNKRQADRIKVILALAEGFSHKDIARMLRLDDSTTRRYEQEYDEGGLDELLEDHFTGGIGKLTENQEKLLESHLSETTYGSAKEVCAYLKTQFAISYTPQGLVPLLHRLGFSYKKTKQVPGKADPERQRAFLKLYRRIRKKSKQGNVVLYFLDGSHPQHNSMPAYGWIKKGVEKELKTNTGRKRINLNGALNIENHTVVVRQEDTINAEATIRLFKDIEAKHPEADAIHCIADNARYYRARDVQDYVARSKIKLVFLPPYAPNLNLIERLWKFFHKKMLYNRYYASYAEFQDAVRGFFKDVNDRRYADELATLLVENFQIIGVQNSQS
jgi:transposase